MKQFLMGFGHSCHTHKHTHTHTHTGFGHSCHKHKHTHTHSHTQIATLLRAHNGVIVTYCTVCILLDVIQATTETQRNERKIDDVKDVIEATTETQRIEQE